MHTFENLFYFKLITFKNTKINKTNRERFCRKAHSTIKVISLIAKTKLK